MSAVARIVIDEAPGETRAAAFDGSDRPVRLFIERWGGLAGPVRLGDVVPGRLRRASPKDGGAFFELESGDEVFVRGEPKLSEGARTELLVVAEARRGKLARAALTHSPSPATSPLERWLASASGGTAINVERGFGLSDEAFELALSRRIGLAGGGAIEIERTTALVAVDVDTSGREAKGSAGARAFAVNREAVAEAARQLALRGLGGLCVIDCIAPVNRDSGQKLKDIFVQAFGSVSGREVDALAPSRFGLLEAKLAWAEAPIADWFVDETGAITAETELLSVLRDAYRETTADRSGFYSVALSPRARGAYIARKQRCDALLQEWFSGRLSISPEAAERSKVSRQ